MINHLFEPATEEPFQLSPIKAIELAASRIPDSVSLAQGIPSFQTPQVIRDFIIEKIRIGACDKYSLTTGLAELREEISLSLAHDGLRYDPETEIIVTAGAVEGITASLMACTNRGDHVIVPSPTYASYLGSLAMAGCTPVFVELDEENNFDFHVDKIEKALTRKTKALLFCSPNNPTGTLFSEEKIRALVDIAAREDLIIIVDEVYKDFYYTAHRHFTPAAIPAARTRLVRVCSFSKAFAMTGWRVGFLHADSSLTRKILKYHDAMVTCAPVVSQYGAIAALRYGEACLGDFRNELRRRRDFAIRQLDQMSHILDYQMPHATYFVFPRIKDTVRYARDSTKLAYDILEKAKVAVVPGVAFGPSGESHLRINYGREFKDLELGMTRIAEYFSTSRVDKLKAGEMQAGHSTAGSSGHSFLSVLAPKVLSIAAQIYLRRQKPLVIGIVGTLGKTVLKRVIFELLRTHAPSRTNILSYNTELGLPLSILNLRPPSSYIEQAYFPFRLAWHALALPDSTKILVLEYGIYSANDAKTLLKIAKPSWLIIAGLSSADPSLDYRQIAEGVKVLIKAVDSSHIFWAADDPLLSTLGMRLEDTRALNPAELSGGKLRTSRHTYNVSRELVGRSSTIALLAAARLGEELGVAQSTIEKLLLNQ